MALVGGILALFNRSRALSSSFANQVIFRRTPIGSLVIAMGALELPSSAKVSRTLKAYCNHKSAWTYHGQAIELAAAIVDLGLPDISKSH